MPRRRKQTVTYIKKGSPLKLYAAVLIFAVLAGGAYYVYQAYSGSPTPPPAYQGTLNIYGLSGGANIAASITVTGSTTYSGTTTTDPNAPLKFTLNPGTYTVTGTYDSESLENSETAVITAGHSTSVTLSFAGVHSLTGTWTQTPTPVLNDPQGPEEPNVIYDTNPQILIGNAHVYKMWYRGGWTDTEVSYAESADGVTWVRYNANPVLGPSGPTNFGYCCPFVFKYNNAYYMYVHDSIPGISQYVSNNGLSWTLTAQNCLPPGNGGWDGSSIGNNCVWVENGQWYMIYEACGYGQQYYWNMGVATSPDGRVWTKSSNNPLMPGGGPDVVKFGSTYYMWYSGYGTAAYPDNGIWLTTSTNPLLWSNTSFSSNPCVWPKYSWEGVIGGVPQSGGQTSDPSVVVVGNSVRMWFDALSSQSASGSSIGMATLQPSS